jgi:hypothetical protein
VFFPDKGQTESNASGLSHCSREARSVLIRRSARNFRVAHPPRIGRKRHWAGTFPEPDSWPVSRVRID